MKKMVECKRVENKEANDKVLDAQEQIIEMVKQIYDEDYLFKIYHYILPKYNRNKKETGY